MNTIKYFYIRTPNKHIPEHRGAPIACVAYKRDKDPDQDGMDYIMLAMSITSPGDEFSKPLARKIAGGRLDNIRSCCDGLQIESTATSTEVIRRLVEYVRDADAYGLFVPGRVKSAASKWLKATVK